ncbi:hypothetical protein SteCoe_23116 [Stentor coeruleus]|uniref:Protein kinase domain-containing protein n=1 Tax=Stentor coeruleus TaxID=5963 RepID=A0A1R2BKM8_9CILI|nr:hypothetical protein SteCoe_23116 [Stentor coeruleus]
MDKFKQIKVIYRTGSVEVTKNINTENNSICCLKILNVNDIEDATYLTKEINNLHSLRNSPHFVKMLDYIFLGTGREIEKICIVTKYYEKGDLGRDLEKREKSLSKFDEKELENHIKFLLEGFKHLQENQISHRDIKPENIFIDDNNNLIIGDLGSCNSQLYEKQTIIGSMHYMSPEVRYNFSEFQKGNVGPRVVYNSIKSDVWSLGLTFLYMISMKNVREFSDPLMIDVNINKRINGIANSMFKGLLERMIKKNPDERMDFIELYEYFSNEISVKYMPPPKLDPFLPLNVGVITNTEINPPKSFTPILEPASSINIPSTPKPIPSFSMNIPSNPKQELGFPMNLPPIKPELVIQSNPAFPMNVVPYPRPESVFPINAAPPKLDPVISMNVAPSKLGPVIPMNILPPPKLEPIIPINMTPPPKLDPNIITNINPPPKLEPNIVTNITPPQKLESNIVKNITSSQYFIHPQPLQQTSVNNLYTTAPVVKSDDFSTSLNKNILPEISGLIPQNLSTPLPYAKTQEFPDMKKNNLRLNENPSLLYNNNPPNEPILPKKESFNTQSYEIHDNKNLIFNPNNNPIIIDSNEKNENYPIHNKFPAPAPFPKPQFEIPGKKSSIELKQNSYMSDPSSNLEPQRKSSDFNYNPVKIPPAPEIPKSINTNLCQFCHKSDNLIQCELCCSKAHPFCMSLYNKKCILCPPTFNINTITLPCTSCYTNIDIKDIKACNHTYCLKCRQSINCDTCTEINTTLSKTLGSKGFGDNYQPICHICKKPNNLIQCDICSDYLHAYCFNFQSHISECKNHIDKIFFKLYCSKCKNQFSYNQVKFCNHLNCDKCQMLESNCKYCFEFEVVDEAAKHQPAKEMRCMVCNNYYDVQKNSYVCEKDRIRLCVICKAFDHQGPCIFSDTKTEAFCTKCQIIHSKLPHNFTFFCPTLEITICLICQSTLSEKSHLNCSYLYQSSNLP